MNVSLTPQLEKLIKQKVASGKYNSASEVVREALRLLEEQDELHKIKLEALKRDIMIGVADLDAGRFKTYSSGQDLFGDIRNRGQRRIERRAKGKK